MCSGLVHKVKRLFNYTESAAEQLKRKEGELKDGALDKGAPPWTRLKTRGVGPPGEIAPADLPTKKKSFFPSPAMPS